MSNAVVKLVALDGTVEHVGSDRAAGIWHENLVASADPAGPSKASFDLKRNPGRIFPDLAAFGEAIIEDNGVPVWAGRVLETPTRDGVDRAINVQLEGWQYQLDDDTYDRKYVHTRLADWKDTRSASLHVSLTRWPQYLALTNDNGVIVIGAHAGVTWVNSDAVGVTLDMGIGNAAKRIVLQVQRGPGGAAGPGFYVRGHDDFTGDYFSGSDAIAGTAWNTISQAAGGQTMSGTFATARRYVSVFLYNGGASYAVGADDTLRIMAIKVFSDTAYETSNVSILKASDVVKDGRNRTVNLLSTSDELITNTVTSIPEFAPEGDHTPRENYKAVNALHDWVLQVDVQKRVVFKAKPSVAFAEIGEWSGAEFEDASANSGEEIFNRVVVQGRDAAGTPIRVERYTGGLAEFTGELVTSPSNSNPNFASNVTGWTHNAGTFAWDNTFSDPADTPASGRADVAGAGAYFVQSPAYSGTFRRGVTYKLTVYISLGNDIGSASLQLGEGADMATKTLQWVTLPNTTSHTIVWTPTADRTAAVLRLNFTTTGPASGAIYIDNLKLYVVTNATLVDRRGFRRTKILPISHEINQTLADTIGDIWLRGHRTTPLKGTVKASGRQACRHILSGQTIPPSHLLLRTMELLRLSHRIDPDSGGLTRDARLVQVTWDATRDEAQTTLDNSRASVEALMERIALNVSQVR